MAHSCCEVNKEPHFLDERLPEWRVFEAVQPIFASPQLRWRTQESNPQSTGDPNETAWRIRFEDAFDEFQVEIQGLPEAAPEKDLACEVFEDCRDNLCNLLDLLEKLTQQSVIGAAGALPDLEEDVGDSIDPKVEQKEMAQQLQPPEPQYPPSSYVSSWFESITRPFFIPTQLPTPEPEPVPSPISPLSSVGDSPSSVRKRGQYFKLQALGKLSQKASGDGAEAVELCANYLRLVLDGSEYIKGFETVRDFNICMTSPQVAGVSRLPEMSYPLEISKTRWKDTGPSEISRRLFRIICTKAAGSSCVHGLRQKHEAMLRLNGFQLEQNQPAFDMFFMPCKPPDVPEWQQVQFVPNTQQYGLRPQHVFALCSDIIDSRPQLQSDPSVLSFMFDEKKLSRMTADILGHSGALPTMSLEELLRSDFVREPRAGGAFNPGDKAMLALSLSRCLLHLHQDPWMEKPWNAESVHFLHKQATHEVLDIHHPYIPYPFDKSKFSKKSIELDIESYRRLLLSFARLLLEIDQGHPVEVDLDDPSNLDTARNTLLELLENDNREGEPLVHYYQAIKGCLNFKASLTALRRREPKSKPDQQIRKVIYNNIIQHLEKNLSIIPRHAKFALTRRNLQMNKRAIKSVPSNELPPNQKPVQRRDTLRSKKALPRSPALHCANMLEKLPLRNLDLDDAYGPRMIMFDGQTTYNNEHVTQASVFLDDLHAFHRQYIHPKTQRRSSSSPRIRIAILDTGLDPEDSCIEGLIDDISEERWKTHTEEVKEQRANGNQVKMRRHSEFSPITKVESFVGGESRDTCGHGTHMASLVLKVSPDADIYVAKISEKLEFEDTAPVVKAIEWAIAQEVDIISMSFGTPDRRPEIAAAIDKASKQIMFAAASNGGKNRPRTYPATDPRVIGIHAMSGHGEGGPINPATEHEHDCLGTLGFGIKLRWKDEVVYKNGTSYATPIAAAIAANWLEWLNAVASDGRFDVTEVQHTNWRSVYGVKRIFSRAMSQRHQDLYCVAPWHLWKHDKILSDSDILGAIRGKDGL